MVVMWSKGSLRLSLEFIWHSLSTPCSGSADQLLREQGGFKPAILYDSHQVSGDSFRHVAQAETEKVSFKGTTLAPLTFQATGTSAGLLVCLAAVMLLFMARRRCGMGICIRSFCILCSILTGHASPKCSTQLQVDQGIAMPRPKQCGGGGGAGRYTQRANVAAYEYRRQSQSRSMLKLKQPWSET